MATDARGKWVTTGVIDTHLHLGASGSPSISAHDDTNECSSPNAAEAWIELRDRYLPQVRTHP